MHALDHISLVGHPSVPEDQPRTFTHRLLAEVEHAPVTTDQHRIVAHSKQRARDVLMYADQHLTKAEMVSQVSVRLLWKTQPLVRARRRGRESRKVAPLLEDRFGSVRLYDPDDQRREEEPERKEREIAAVLAQHAKSGAHAFPAIAGAAPA